MHSGYTYSGHSGHHSHYSLGGHRQSLSERFASYYGNIRTALLGSNLQGRRTNYQDTIFHDDAQLTSFKKDKEMEAQLRPKKVKLNQETNREVHHTSDYEMPYLIVRRGQTFTISIQFDRPFEKGDDTIVLKLVTGTRPLQSKGTVISIPEYSHAQSSKGWGYVIEKTEDTTVHLEVSTSVNAVIGRYQFFVETSWKSPTNDRDKYRYKHADDFYILFNPWCKEDPVYLEDDNQRQEYVLSETGRIWLGTVGRFCVRPWNYGQFEDISLVAALALLDKSEMGDTARSNPVLVVKSICKVINNNERDGGVIVGNWSGKYDDGVAPFAWNGSPAILEEFLKKRKGVKFGQCWTFAAVTTTLFRTLGIPTRCVTNFKSAHDSDYGNPIDVYWTTDGKPRKSLDDAIWDFHVWNESWFRRPDLPEGYDGWQAYDPTPQECPEGVFTCGPASVKAIKNGELYLGYDAKFLFAEVNGDRLHWTVDNLGNMTPVGKEATVVGRYLSTKAVNTISREDLTSAYKFPEDSTQGKTILDSAARLCFRELPPVNESASMDIEFKFHGECSRGGDISASLKMRNSSKDSRCVEVYFSAISAVYTGVSTSDLKEDCSSVVLEPLTESQISMNMKATEYVNHMEADAHVNVYVMAVVKETGQRFITREAIWIEKPHLDLRVEGSAVVGKAFEVVVKLSNTLNVPLGGGYINIEGPGMQRISAVKVKKPVNPGDEFRETVQLKPRRSGRKEIIGCFSCKQISDVTGVIEIEIHQENKT